MKCLAELMLKFEKRMSDNAKVSGVMTTFSRHFLPRLPTIVREDVKGKVRARSARSNATKANLEHALNDAVKHGLKCAPFIEDKYSFVDSRHKSQSERLTHDLLMSDDAIKKLAIIVADENAAMMNDITADSHSSFIDAMSSLYICMSENISEIHINAPYQGAKKLFANEDLLSIAVLKMQSEEWILKRLINLRSQYVEYSQIALGRVGKNANQQKYISHRTFATWMQKQRDAKKFIENTVVYNEETGEQYDLSEVVKRTTANPENRRIEMMVRSRGFEELAQDLGYTALFITWTLPGKYHPSSKKWNGASIKDGHKVMMHKWSIVRAMIAKGGVDYFGFRVSEPHKDACSHGHYFLFCSQENKGFITNIIRDVAINEDRCELCDDISPRFKVIEADPSKGGATAYIAKYVSKNINGAHMPEDEADKAAYFVRAWASTHKIRQFQQFGGEPVSLWRQLRRAKPEQTKHDDVLEELRQAADTSKWSLFCKLAKNAKIEYEKKANKYGETVSKIIGFSFMNLLVETASTGFRLVKKSEVGALLKSRSDATWSTENKCNSVLTRGLETLLGWSNNGVQCLVNPLLDGRKIRIDRDLTLSVRNGRLVTYGCEYD